jgi:mannose-6-phosphate isomerase-like protein (cupin superfamily)
MLNEVEFMKHVKLSDSTFEPREGYERSLLLTADDFKAATKLQLMRLAPGQCIKPHHHNTRTECFRFVSGTGQIKINGEVVASSEDDVVLCEAGDVHEFINTSTTEPLIFLVIRTNDLGNEDMIWEE